ncbi:M3 family metallopeptidase [Deferribacteraceae bacterium V6Fe1]|nr:M3 family metallopeptidase [Deferribacteraceae bacterium V6Fe1]
MFRDISKFEIKGSAKNLKGLINETEQKINKLKNSSIDESFLLKYQEITYPIGLEFTPLSHFNSVKNSKLTQKEYAKAINYLTDFHTKLSQDEDIYQKLKTYQNQFQIDTEKKEVLTNLIREYELSGVGLEDTKKSRIKEINLKLSELTNNFFQNVLNDTNNFKLQVNEADIKDMPESDKAAYKKGELFEFTLHAPSYISFMTFCNNREKREVMYKHYFTRAKQNSEIISEILSLRDEMAKILGFKNYAELSLATKDAKTPQQILDFLYEMIEPCKKKAENELAELKEIAHEFGIKKIMPYDTAFLSEKLKMKKFGYKDEDFRVYFEKDNVVNGMFAFLEKFLGIVFKKIDIPLWHKKAEAFDLKKNGKVIGRLYMDLEARKGKRDGAWMHDYETRFKDMQGNIHLPSAFVVANFPKSTSKIRSLLRPSDVETLFHEMGHALHHLLSDVDNLFVSGINGVKWDVVEFPSQFLENFYFESKVLDMIATHYKTGEKMPDDMKKTLKKMKNFNSGIMFLRQLEFAIFDMEIHHKNITNFEDAHNILKKIRGKTSMFEVPEYVLFENQFSHIFSGGYAAGYYSYKWAERLSADAFYLFVENNIFDAKLANNFVEKVLSKGGSINITEAYEKFAGRKVDNNNLLKLYDIM